MILDTLQGLKKHLLDEASVPPIVNTRASLIGGRHGQSVSLERVLQSLKAAHHQTNKERPVDETTVRCGTTLLAKRQPSGTVANICAWAPSQPWGPAGPAAAATLHLQQAVRKCDAARAREDRSSELDMDAVLQEQTEAIAAAHRKPQSGCRDAAVAVAAAAAAAEPSHEDRADAPADGSKVESQSARNKRRNEKKRAKARARRDSSSSATAADGDDDDAEAAFATRIDSEALLASADAPATAEATNTMEAAAAANACGSMEPLAPAPSSTSPVPATALASPQAAMRGNECVVCMDDARTHAFVPCGHKAVCKACSESLRTTLCPMCREPFSSVWRIYD